MNLEQRLFFLLLNRWAKRNKQKLKTANGLLCLTRDEKLQIKEWRQPR